MANFDFEVDVSSKSEEVLSAFREQLNRALEAIGSTAEGHAKDNCPVDTGRLRNSIAYAVDGNDVYIGTNVEYAEVVEYRDIAHKTGQAHFLRDSATTHGDEYQAIMDSAMRS